MKIQRDTLRTAILVSTIALCTLVIWRKLDNIEYDLNSIDSNVEVITSKINQ